MCNGSYASAWCPFHGTKANSVDPDESQGLRQACAAVRSCIEEEYLRKVQSELQPL